MYARLIGVLEDANINFEIVFVDDGSGDESVRRLNELGVSDKRVVVIELARNFGHQVAITAGLDFARGRAIAVMDADLQDPPEVLPQFIAKWREGYDVVYAIREQRKEGWLKRTSYAIFLPLAAARGKYRDSSGRRRFLRHGSAGRRSVGRACPSATALSAAFAAGSGLIRSDCPSSATPATPARRSSTSGRLMLPGLGWLDSFSYVPLRIITILELAFLSVDFAGRFFFVKKLLYGLNPPGFASIIVSIFFLAGIQLITIGVIGEYVGRIFEEVKRRPLYVLRRLSGGQR